MKVIDRSLLADGSIAKVSLTTFDVSATPSDGRDRAASTAVVLPFLGVLVSNPSPFLLARRNDDGAS